MMMNQAERAALSDEEIVRRFRARHFVPRKHPRSFVPKVDASGRGLFARACCWLLPWQIKDYPGRHRGIFQALQGKRSLGTILRYLKEARRMPEEIALLLAGLIRSRCAAGLALVEELEAYAARPAPGSRRRGFMTVDQATGLSGRVKTGKRRRVESV